MIVSPLQHLDCERSFSFLFYVLGFSGDASMLPKVPIPIIPLAGYQSSNLFVTLSLVRHVPGNDHYQDETEMWRTVEHSVKFQGRLNVINDQKSIQFSVSVYSIRMPNPKQVMEFVWLSMANEMWKKTSLIRRFLCRCLFFYSVAHHLYQLISQFEERKRRREKNVEGRCIRLIHIRSFILSFPLPFFLQPDCGSYMAINTSFRS